MASDALRSGFRLRAMLIPVYIPTLILCICCAIIIHDVLPVLGLIPCTASFVHCSAVVLRTWRNRRNGTCDDEGEELGNIRLWPMKKKTPVLTSPILAAFVDVAISSLLLANLVCTWTLSPWENGYWGYSQGRVVLATYTTVPMIFECIAHAWLSILDIGEIVKAMRHYRNTPAECPNCHARFHNSDNRIDMAQGDRAEDYTINRPSEQTERTFRDTSFDSDAAIAPGHDEAATTGSKDS